jgi:hypothetical protein
MKHQINKTERIWEGKKKTINRFFSSTVRLEINNNHQQKESNKPNKKKKILQLVITSSIDAISICLQIYAPNSETPEETLPPPLLTPTPSTPLFNFLLPLAAQNLLLEFPDLRVKWLQHKLVEFLWLSSSECNRIEMKTTRESPSFFTCQPLRQHRERESETRARERRWRRRLWAHERERSPHDRIEWGRTTFSSCYVLGSHFLKGQVSPKREF